MIGSVVVFSSASVMAAPVPEFAAFVIPVTTALVQTNVALELLLRAVYVVDVLLQRWGAVVVLVITAVGFTVAVTLKVVPAQPFTEGITT